MTSKGFFTGVSSLMNNHVISFWKHPITNLANKGPVHNIVSHHMPFHLFRIFHDFETMRTLNFSSATNGNDI
jgi:hypothetical protein